MLNATIKFPQLRAVDFINISNFACKTFDSKIINLSLFIFGSLKHLLLLSDGTLPSVSKAEYNSPLQNLINMMEIVCLGSSNEDFNNLSWKITREYNSQLVNDMEVGFKNWDNLNRSIDPTCWAFAKEYVSPSDFAPLTDDYDSVSLSSDLPENCVLSDQDEFHSPQDYTDYVSPHELDGVEGYINGKKNVHPGIFSIKMVANLNFLNPGTRCCYIHHCSICI